MMKTMKTRMKMKQREVKTTTEKLTCPSHLLQSKGQSMLTKVGCTQGGLAGADTLRVGFYQASSLCEVGLTIYFGHNGQCCPQFSVATRLTVVDITGVHCMRVGWCRCQPKEDHMQLLQARLYPASITSPRTAFTFCVLDDFLVSNKVSGCPAQSYYEHIRRVTDSAFPDKVPVSHTKKTSARL